MSYRTSRAVLSDESRCLIGRVGRVGRIGRARWRCPIGGAAGRTSRTRWTSRTHAMAMPYRRGRRVGGAAGRTSRMGQRSLCGSYGSRQGSPLHSHRSSRVSGDDLWADRPLDLDPARVSHIPVSQSVRHPSGVAGSITISDPRVVGATPLRPVARKLAPTRGASPPPGALSYRTGRCPIGHVGRVGRARWR